MRATFLIALTAGSWAAAAPGTKDKDPPKPSPLVGEWRLVSTTTLGSTRPWDLNDHVFVFTADGRYGDKADGADDPGTWHKYTADDKADPKTVDLVITGKDGKAITWRWLYRVDGDTLEYCWRADDPTVRPKEFEAGPGSKNAIYTLKKMKPKK
jgi:uncharacterized protein (TIGR03067 family)